MTHNLGVYVSITLSIIDVVAMPSDMITSANPIKILKDELDNELLNRPKEERRTSC